MEQKTNFKTTVVNVARWVVCLPASMAASVLAWYVSTSLSRISLFRYEADEDGVFTMLVGSVVMGACFVFTGTQVAPGNRPFVPWLFSTLCACFFGSVAYRLMHSGRWIDLALSFAMVVAAFLTALVLTKNQEHA